MLRNTTTLTIIAVVAVFGVIMACGREEGTEASLAEAFVASLDMADIECEYLIPIAVEMFEKESTMDSQVPRVLKLYEEHLVEVVRTSTKLVCGAIARMSKGDDWGIQFSIEEDADGDRFFGIVW